MYTRLGLIICLPALLFLGLGTVLAGQAFPPAENGLSAAASPDATTNLLPPDGDILLNPGFEEDDGTGRPAHWAVRPEPPPAGAAFAWDSSTFHSGTHSAQIAATAPPTQTLRWHQFVPVQGDTDYDLAGYLKTENVTGLGASLQVHFLDGAGQLIPNSGNATVHRTAARAWEKAALRARSPVTATLAAVSAALDGTGTAWFDDLSFAPADGTPFAIEVDAAAVVGQVRSLQGVNAGPRPIVDSRLADVSDGYRDLGVDFVRTNDYYGPCDVNTIFPDWDADPTIETSYHFTSTDREIWAIEAVGADVVFRLGYSWGYPHAPVTYIAAEDRAKWAEVARHIVMHYNDGWANGFHYDIRYWEIWNEPDIQPFWTGTPQEYYALYETTARALKAHDPTFKVGGPSFCCNWSFYRDFLAYVQANAVPLDFISWHTYAQAPYAFPAAAARVRDLAYRYGFNDVEFLITEWNYTAQAPSDMFWSARGAAWNASVLAYMQDAPITISNRYRGNGGGEDGGGFGLFYDDGRFKKTAYAYLAHRMLLETPLRLAASGSDTQGYAVLAGKSADREASLCDERAVTILVSDVQSDRGGYTLTVDHLPWGAEQAFVYDRYLLDATHDLALVESQVMTGTVFGSTEAMTAESVQVIRLHLP